jgi:hypothetical protein
MCQTTTETATNIFIGYFKENTRLFRLLYVRKLPSFTQETYVYMSILLIVGVLKWVLRRSNDEETEQP